jgi:hypothetical protein
VEPVAAEAMEIEGEVQGEGGGEEAKSDPAFTTPVKGGGGAAESPAPVTMPPPAPAFAAPPAESKADDAKADAKGEAKDDSKAEAKGDEEKAEGKEEDGDKEAGQMDMGDMAEDKSHPPPDASLGPAQAAPETGEPKKRQSMFNKMKSFANEVKNLEDNWNKSDDRYSCVQGTLTYRIVLLDATERVEEWIDEGKPKVEKDEAAIVLRIMDAMDLAKADATGASDPYVRVMWNHREIFRTKAINDDCNPQWEDTGCFLPLGKYRAGQLDHLKLEVYDKEALQIGWDMGDFLGELIFEGDFLKQPVFEKYKQDYVLQQRVGKDPEAQKLVQGTLSLHFSRKRHKMLINNGIWWPDDDNSDGRKPREWLHFNIKKALGLAKADSAILGMGGGSDPYVKVWFCREEVFESKVVNNNQNPEFSDGTQDVALPMKGYTFGPPELRIAIYDKDTVGEDEFLGQVFLYGDEVLESHHKTVMQKKLEGRMGVANEEVTIQGEVFITTHTSVEPSFLSMIDKFDLCLPYDIVGLQIVGANNLPKADRMGLSDPYAVVYWKGEEVARTPTISDTLNPKWDREFFLFAIPKDLDTMELRVELYDDDLGAAGAIMGSLVDAAGGSAKGDFLGRVTLKRDALMDPPLFKKDYLLDGGPDRKKKSRQKKLDELEAQAQNTDASEKNHYVVEVSVHKARGLAKADFFGKSDPCVVAVYNGKEIGRSPIIKKTLDPDWGCFQFPAIKIDAELEDGEQASAHEQGKKGSTNPNYSLARRLAGTQRVRRRLRQARRLPRLRELQHVPAQERGLGRGGVRARGEGGPEEDEPHSGAPCRERVCRLQGGGSQGGGGGGRRGVEGEGGCGGGGGRGRGPAARDQTYHSPPPAVRQPREGRHQHVRQRRQQRPLHRGQVVQRQAAAPHEGHQRQPRPVVRRRECGSGRPH